MDKLTQITHIYKVTSAIDNCEDIEIPYPTAKKMAEVSKELKGYLERSRKGGKMNCPECKKELNYVHAYSQCFQRVGIDGKGQTLEWSSPNVLEGTDFKCPYCAENITKIISL